MLNHQISLVKMLVSNRRKTQISLVVELVIKQQMLRQISLVRMLV
jgi:hypothetical protein